ncbi:hypothetical protein Atc_2061 [Acidithiobacillus caldus SM-1]|uniref:Uncharacterized protein n=1 Tax=Acidithiobacillus caldus (strain SM-1) TaxID=990288 RepID=F9ZQM8_ACICS|nr:hypothetical protein Atc_2061 [Acidithiobacillus caldus SM-1]
MPSLDSSGYLLRFTQLTLSNPPVYSRLGYPKKLRRSFGAHKNWPPHMF